MKEPIKDSSGLVSERTCISLRLKTCDPGYEVNDMKDGCVDIDECSFISCPYLSQCKNLPGSYACPCKIGFEPSESGHISNTTSRCIDRNECDQAQESNSDLCYSEKTNKRCVNTFGSFDCVCKDGFEPYSNPDRLDEMLCRDIDECIVDRLNSEYQCSVTVGSDSHCKNTIGSFDCVCNIGYKPDSNGICTDIDECTALTSGEFLQIPYTLF